MPEAFSGFWKTSPPNKHTSSSTGSSVIPAAVPTIVSAMANGHYLLPSNKNIINILKECGVTFSIEFDSYFEDYYWSNTL